MVDKSLRIYNVLWSSRNGGPSPDGDIRTELFLSGCSRAEHGHPCEGCFNVDLWDKNNFIAKEEPEEILEKIKKFAPNKFITIVGGEPMDQGIGLSYLCRLLKMNGFHVLLFTSVPGKTLYTFYRKKFPSIVRLLHNVDVIIDGEYKKEEHLLDPDINTAFNNSVGSGNQIIWDFHGWNKSGHKKLQGYYARDLADIYVHNNHELTYLYKDNAESVIINDDVDYLANIEEAM